jgi:uncharacterized LabA/DUF88 family protein
MASTVQARAPRYYVYVDAGYVREECVRAGISPEFHPHRILGQLLGVGSPSRFFFYDAIDDSDPQRAAQQKAYLTRVQRLPFTHVVTGTVRGRKGKRRQKGVDVALAVDALEAAHAKIIEAIVLVTGDADFAPLADAIRRAGPHVYVLAAPASLAADLRDAADQVFSLQPPPPARADQWALSAT